MYIKDSANQDVKSAAMSPNLTFLEMTTANICAYVTQIYTVAFYRIIMFLWLKNLIKNIEQVTFSTTYFE